MKQDKITNILANNIKTKRLALNITQEQLCEILDIHKNTISLIETGKRWVGADMLENLAKVLKCEPFELLKNNKK